MLTLLSQEHQELIKMLQVCAIHGSGSHTCVRCLPDCLALSCYWSLS